MKNILLLVVAMLLIIDTSTAQLPTNNATPHISNLSKNGQIKGKIVDADTGTPMEYANIGIYRQKDSTLITGGLAGSEGSFEITEVPFGLYYVVANFIGYKKTTINNVRIVPNESTVDLGILKLRAASQQLNGIDVVADKERIQYKIDKKVVNVSQDISSAGGTAADVLENTPSVDVDIEGNVSLRGSESFTVLIDGRPSAMSGSDALKQIPASTIDNIEVITNPSVKYDPDGVAGIINVIMKKNILSGFNGILNVHAATGDKYRSDLTLNYKTKKYNLFLGVNWNDDTFNGKMTSNRETYNGDTILSLDINGSRDFGRSGRQLKGGIDYYLSEKSTLTLSGEFGNYSFKRIGTGSAHEYSVLGEHDFYSIQQTISKHDRDYTNIISNFSHKFDENGLHKLEASFFYSKGTGYELDNENEIQADNEFNSQGIYTTQIRTSEDERSDEYRLKVDYVKPTKAGDKIEAGFQSRLDRETEDYIFEEFDPLTQTWLDNDYYNNSMKFKRDIHSFYGTYSGGLASFKYMAGIRGEYTKRTIEHTLETEPSIIDRIDWFPSLHVSYETANKDQIMASYSRRINRPRGWDLEPYPNYINSYTIRIGNPNITPEYTNSYEASYMKRFGKSFLSIEAFHRATKDLITRILETDGNGIYYLTSQNLNNDYSTGTEIMGNFNLNKWLLINASTSLYYYQIKGDIEGQDVNRESTNFTGRLNSTIKFSPISRLQLMGIYRGPTVSAQGDREGMIFTNLAFRQDLFKRKITATLTLHDIFGTMKREGTSYGENFKTYYKMQREARVFGITISYKINNYKIDKQQNGEEGNRDDQSFDESF